MKKIFFYSVIIAFALCSCGKSESTQSAEEINSIAEEQESAIATPNVATKVKDDAVITKEISETEAVFSTDEDVMTALEGVVYYNTDGKDPGASIAFKNGSFIHNDGVVRSVMIPTIQSRGQDRAVFNVHEDLSDGSSLDYTVTYYGRDNVIILDMPSKSCAFAISKDIEE